MVRPIPSTIASDSEDETVRNIELAFQSLNIRSPDRTQSDLNDTDADASAVTDENDESKDDTKDEEGAVGFNLSSTIELNSTQDDVFDSSIPFSLYDDSTKDESFSTPNRFRSHSSNLQDSVVSSSDNSRVRRHSASESFLSDASSQKEECTKQADGDKADAHTCCSPRAIRVEESESLNEGAAIYREFLREEFRRRNIQEPPCLNSSPSNRSRMRANSMADVVRASNQLCFMSDQFARSPMRQWVQEQADCVPLNNLDFNSFSDLLYGLFQEGGVTWERVLVLFFFCADVSIRAFREKLEGQFHDIINWSLQFISGKKFTQWIQDNGGWARVLQSSVDQAYKLAIIGFCAMGMFAIAAYLWRKK